MVSARGLHPDRYRPAAEAGAPEPVTVTVTGKTLSVNDHDMVPAGLFGGFAPFLPQRYRPGTQRNLNTLPGAYVQNPFKVYLYGGSQVNDGIAFARLSPPVPGRNSMPWSRRKTSRPSKNRPSSPRRKRASNAGPAMPARNRSNT